MNLIFESRQCVSFLCEPSPIVEETLFCIIFFFIFWPNSSSYVSNSMKTLAVQNVSTALLLKITLWSILVKPFTSRHGTGHVFICLSKHVNDVDHVNQRVLWLAGVRGLHSISLSHYVLFILLLILPCFTLQNENIFSVDISLASHYRYENRK